MNATPRIPALIPTARLSLAALAMIIVTGTAWAQPGPAAAPADGHRGPGHGMQGERPQLLTQEEREQFRSRMHAAKTPEERQAVRDGMRSLAEQRAKEKGITLPAPRAGRDGERSRHHGMRHGEGRGEGHGERHGMRDGKRGGGDRPQLFSQEERQQFRDKMHAAKTPEERKTLRNEMRTLAEQRAREKGINLQEHRGPGRHRHGPQGESSRG